MANVLNSDNALRTSVTVLLFVVAATLAALTSPDGNSTQLNGQSEYRSMEQVTNGTMLEERTNHETFDHRSGECVRDPDGHIRWERMCFPLRGFCAEADPSSHNYDHLACDSALVRTDPCVGKQDGSKTEQCIDTHQQTCHCNKGECQCMLRFGYGLPKTLKRMMEIETYGDVCQPDNVYQNACPNDMAGYCMPPTEADTDTPYVYYCLLTGERPVFIPLIEANICSVPKMASCKSESILEAEKDCLKECPPGTTGHFVNGDSSRRKKAKCVCALPPVGKSFPEVLPKAKASKKFKEGNLLPDTVACMVKGKVETLAACNASCTASFTHGRCKPDKNKSDAVSICECVNSVTNRFIKVVKRIRKICGSRRTKALSDKQ